MDQSSFLYKFLGIKRWLLLRESLVVGFNEPLVAKRNFVDVILAIVLCSLGPALSTAEIFYQSKTTLLSTVGFGISAAFAILFQRSIQRTDRIISNQKALSLTHTAFAVGCIPAIAVVALFPSLLAQREQLLSSSNAASGNAQVSSLEIYFYIACFTLWVAIIEEYLFRGLLLSVLRRYSLLKTPFSRTLLACLVSGVLFGLAHWPLWGGAASLALTGIGIGLGLGYIANGEKIWPLILYHWAFDLLSTAVALLG